MASEFTFSGFREFAACLADVIDRPDGGIADVVFRVEDQRFGGLRNVLSCRCPVFDRMFNGDFKESKQRVSDGALGKVQDPADDVAMQQFTSPKAFRAFLMYMHCGQVSLDELPLDLHEIAKFFGMEELRRLCEDCILQVAVSADNALSILRFAELNDMEALRSATARAILRMAGAVFEDPAASVPQASHTFFLEMYRSSCVSISETLLFRLLLEMTPHHQEELLPLVRLSLLPPADILSLVVPSGLVQKDMLIRVLAFKADPVSVEPPTDQNLEPRLVHEGQVRRLPVQTSSGRGPYEVEFGAANLIGDLKRVCCARFRLCPEQVQMIQLAGLFADAERGDLEDKHAMTLEGASICSDNPILLVEVPSRRRV